jgi:hypothetical protein
MDAAVAFVALIISVVALSAAIRFGRMLAGMPGEISALRRDLDQTRAELESARRELDELKAAAEVLPAPPPLPKTRSAGLDDLRQQLREAHRETDEATDS